MQGNLSLQERTIGNIIEDKANTNGDRTLIFWGDSSFSYKEANDKANQIANSLVESGVKKGENVAIIMDNCPDMLFLWFGLAKIGAVEVPINTAAKGWALEYVLNDSDAEILVVDRAYIDRVLLIQNNLKTIKKLIVFPEVERTSLADLRFSASSFLALYSGTSEQPKVTVKHTDLMAVMYTSGTTGLPKGVMLCHNHEYVISRNVVKVMGLTNSSIAYNFYPAFHNTSQCLITLPMILADGAMAFLPRFSVSKFWDHIAKYKCTAAWLFPAQANLMVKQLPPKKNTLEIVKIYGADAETSMKIEREWGVKVVQGYGSTDANIPVSYLPGEKVKHGSAGKAFAEWEVKIFDQDDNELAPNKVGEIVVRPKESYTLNLGYWKKPKETVEAWRNLWFHTGDAAFLDAEGYLWFSGKIKDSIRYKGENVSALEVEIVINSHPAVLESAVIAVPSEIGEDDVMAVIVLTPGNSLKPEELLKYCESRMAYYAVPRYIEFKDSLPKTEMGGKIKKYLLREGGVSEKTWDREKFGYIITKR